MLWHRPPARGKGRPDAAVGERSRRRLTNRQEATVVLKIILGILVVPLSALLMGTGSGQTCSGSSLSARPPARRCWKPWRPASLLASLTIEELSRIPQIRKEREAVTGTTWC
jgi:hypothetical protein